MMHYMFTCLVQQRDSSTRHRTHIKSLFSLQIVDALNKDPHCSQGNIPQNLENVACILEGEDSAEC